MSLDKVGFPRAFRISGVLLVLGLCIEAISLRWIHPLAFIAFFVIGGSFLAAGVLLFLYACGRYAPCSGRPQFRIRLTRVFLSPAKNHLVTNGAMIVEP